MSSKKQEILANIVKLDLRLYEVRRGIAGLGDMSSLLRRIKEDVKEFNEVPCSNNKQEISANKIEDVVKVVMTLTEIENIVKDMMALPSYLPIESMAPSMKNTFELGVNCILKGTNITLDKKSQLPELEYGDFCRAKCTAPARYMLGGKCLFVATMNNELTIDDVDPFGARENTSNLPIPSDDDLRKYSIEYFEENHK